MSKRKKIIKEAIDFIYERDGIVKPEAVLGYAEPEDSPIHKYFEWEDSKAATMYRLNQAMHLIVEVTVEYAGGERQAYHNVVVELSEGIREQGYFPVEVVTSDEDKYRSAVAALVADLRSLQKKYEELQEMKELINVEKLDNLEREFKKG